MKKILNLPRGVMAVVTYIGDVGGTHRAMAPNTHHLCPNVWSRRTQRTSLPLLIPFRGHLKVILGFLDLEDWANEGRHVPWKVSSVAKTIMGPFTCKVHGQFHWILPPVVPGIARKTLVNNEGVIHHNIEDAVEDAHRPPSSLPAAGQGGTNLVEGVNPSLRCVIEHVNVALLLLD